MPGADSTPAALPRRPEARAFSVEDLVLAVLSGQIRVPIFQRNFRWEIADVLALLDSIDRGYPIGSVLLWKRPARSEHLVHGSVVVDAPERHDALWVVDGQQRILSLTRVLAGKGHPDEPLAVFYDLQARSFKHLAPGESPAPYDLPLTELLDSGRLVDWLVAHHELGLDRHAATSLGKRLREFQLPAYVVDTDDEDTVHAIFLRTNTTGKPLLATDIFHAIRRHRSDSPTSLQDVARSLDALTFGPLADSLILDMLLATRSPALGKVGALQLAPSAVHHTIADFERSARAALTFLRNDAGIPHISLLPYQLPLLALVRFFHFHPEPHPRSRELLARWLWRGSVADAFVWRTAKISDVLATIGPDEHGTVQRLLLTVTHREPDLVTWTASEGSFAPHTSVQRISLLGLMPRDFRTGELVAPPPETLLEEDAYDRLVQLILPPSVTSGLANSVIHPSVPEGIVSAIIDCKSLDILATHAIPQDARRALKYGRHNDFIRIRRAAIKRHLADFIARRTEWDEPDTPPVEALRLRTDD